MYVLPKTTGKVQAVTGTLAQVLPHHSSQQLSPLYCLAPELCSKCRNTVNWVMGSINTWLPVTPFNRCKLFPEKEGKGKVIRKLEL